MKNSGDHNSSLKGYSLLCGNDASVGIGDFMASEANANYPTSQTQDEINLFKFLVENSSDGLAYFEDETLKYASPVYEKMLGYPITPDKFPTLDQVLEYVHPEDLNHVINKIRGGAINRISRQSYEFRQRKSDGTYKWIENAVTRHYSEDIVKTYVISRDIHNRKQKELELHRSEERFKALFSQNVIGFVTTDLTGKVTEANEVFAAISGFQTELLKGEEFISLIHPKDKIVFLSLITNQFHSGKHPVEVRMITATSSVVWLEIIANPIKYRNGITDCLIIAINDITWRKEAEKVLHSNRTMLQAISDNTAALIFSKDTNGRFTFINKAFEKNFGLSQSEVFGKTDFELFDKKFASKYRENDQLVMQKKEPCIIEEEIEKDGVVKVALSVKVPLFDPRGNVTGICGIASDITNVKEKEHELQEVISTKEKLLSIISHDLANPLNSLYGFAQLLHAGYGKASPEATQRNINMILKSAKAITELINTLQQWATIQRNKIRVSPEIIKTWPLVEASFALLESTARNKNIQLINKTSYDLKVFADEKMMDVVLRNIISNAIKFSNPNNSVVVSSSSQNGKTTLCVKDSGVGISENRIKKLFNIKDTDSQPGTAGEKGTGLGLLICKEFVELNGGTIWVNSQPGKGSEFCIKLPHKS